MKSTYDSELKKIIQYLRSTITCPPLIWIQIWLMRPIIHETRESTSYNFSSNSNWFNQLNIGDLDFRLNWVGNENVWNQKPKRMKMKTNTYGHTLPHIVNMYIILATQLGMSKFLSHLIHLVLLYLAWVFSSSKRWQVLLILPYPIPSRPKCVYTYILFYEYLNYIYKLIFFIHTLLVIFFTYFIIISKTLALSSF